MRNISKTLLIGALAIFSLSTSSCFGQSSSSSSEQSSNDEAGKVIEVNEDYFKEHIYDFEANPSEFLYKGKKPAIIDFYATWCGPCRALAPKLSKAAKTHANDIVVYKVDVDKNENLARAFGVRSLPTILFVPLNGNPFLSQGNLHMEQIEEMIKKIKVQGGVSSGNNSYLSGAGSNESKNMATTKFRNELEISTNGSLPKVGELAPDFKGVGLELNEVALGDFKGKHVILNVFPSVDTGVCAASVRRFNREAASLDNTKVICISKDLPFAQKRFCGSEGIANVEMLSAFRYNSFQDGYGLLMQNGPLAGLLARAIFVIDADGKILYEELVPEITQEPNYEAALAVLKN